MSWDTTILRFILLLGYAFVIIHASIPPSHDGKLDNKGTDGPNDKKMDTFPWLLERILASESRQTSTPQESVTLGPLEIWPKRNSSRKQLSPWFEKTLRDEIYRRNLAAGDSGSIDLPKSVRRRTVRSPADVTSVSRRQGRQGLGLSMPGLGVTPQQFLLMQQQQEQEQRMAAAAAAVILQQQMLSIQNQQRLNQRQRPYGYQDYNDDDDSDSDEDDEFDSEEFMSFPIRMGFMPPIPGFQG